MSVCISRGAGPHSFFEADEVKSSTSSEIIAKLNVQDSILTFEDENYWDPIDPSAKPVEIHPELITNEKFRKYSTPKSHLTLASSTLAEYCGRAFQIRTNIENITFPLMMVTFPNCELSSLTATDVIAYCKKTFDYETSEEELYDENTRIPDDSLMQDLLESSKTKPLIFRCSVTDAVQKKIKHRIHLAAEVLSSEKSFIHDLNALKDYWEDAFSKKLKLTEVEMRSLFRDIPTLLRTHNALLEEMQSGSHGFDACYGALFLNYLHEFRLSCAFISNYKKMDEMLREKKKKASFFSKLAEIEANNPDANGRDFQSYYITPVQRYPRYPLLLRDLNKQTPKWHPDKPYLSVALTEVDNVNKNIDNTSRRVKSLVMMQELSNELPEDFSLFDANGREMIMNVPVRIVKPKMGNGMLYLFNDIVLLTAKSKKSQTPLVSRQISSFRFANGKPTIESITVFGDDKEYVVTFSELVDKITWIETFNSYRNSEFAALSSPCSFVTWSDVNLRNQVPSLMNHDGCSIENGAFFFGGLNASRVATATVVIFKNDTFSFRQVVGAAVARSGHTCSAVGKYVYICFGATKSEYLHDIWRYDPDADQMMEIHPDCDDPIEGRTGHSCTVYQNSLYFYGGQGKHRYINEISVYDTTTNKYYVIKDTKGKPPPRTMHAAPLVNHDQIVVIGGKREKGACQDVYIYNISTDIWEHLDSLKITPRFNHRAICCGRWLFLIGGVDKTKLKQTELIDLVNWSLVDDLKEFGNVPAGLSKFAAVYMETDRILCYGGTDDVVAKSSNSTAYILDFSEGMKDIPVIANARRTTPTAALRVCESRDRAESVSRRGALESPGSLASLPIQPVQRKMSLSNKRECDLLDERKDGPESHRVKKRKHKKRVTKSHSNADGFVFEAPPDQTLDASTKSVRSKPPGHVAIAKSPRKDATKMIVPPAEMTPTESSETVAVRDEGVKDVSENGSVEVKSEESPQEVVLEREEAVDESKVSMEDEAKESEVEFGSNEVRNEEQTESNGPQEGVEEAVPEAESKQSEIESGSNEEPAESTETPTNVTEVDPTQEVVEEAGNLEESGSNEVKHEEQTESHETPVSVSEGDETQEVVEEAVVPVPEDESKQNEVESGSNEVKHEEPTNPTQEVPEREETIDIEESGVSTPQDEVKEAEEVKTEAGQTPEPLTSDSQDSLPKPEELDNPKQTEDVNVTEEVPEPEESEVKHEEQTESNETPPNVTDETQEEAVSCPENESKQNEVEPVSNEELPESTETEIRQAQEPGDVEESENSASEEESENFDADNQEQTETPPPPTIPEVETPASNEPQEPQNSEVTPTEPSPLIVEPDAKQSEQETSTDVTASESESDGRHLRLSRRVSRDLGRSQPVMDIEVKSAQKNPSVQFKMEVDAPFPPRFNMEGMCAWLKIDISSLNMFEQRATAMKCRRLWTIHQANLENELKIAKMEMVLSGDLSDMPAAPILMKVYDDSTDMTRIKKINTKDTFEHINSVIRETVGRDCMASVMVSEGVMREMDVMSVKEAYKSIFRGEMHCLFVNAI